WRAISMLRAGVIQYRLAIHQIYSRTPFHAARGNKRVEPTVIRLTAIDSTEKENVMKGTYKRSEDCGGDGSNERRNEPMNLSKLINWMWTPPDSAPRSTILIRCMVGGVFLWEGILKFVYTNQGVGRFTKIGIPAPEVMAHFVAVLEIVGG